MSLGHQLVRQHKFDSVGNLIYSSTSDETGQKLNESHSKYNQFGDKLCTIQIDLNDNEVDSTSYERDYRSNKLIKESCPEIGYSKEYYYNDLGQLVKTTITNEEGPTTSTFHSYDIKGNEIESVWTQNRSKKTTKNIYDNNDKLIEIVETFFEPSDTIGKLFLHKRLTYGPNSKISKEEYLGGYWDFDKETKEYKYDDVGNLIQYHEGQTTIKYTYDRNMRLLTKETARSNGAVTMENYNYCINE